MYFETAPHCDCELLGSCLLPFQPLKIAGITSMCHHSYVYRLVDLFIQTLWFSFYDFKIKAFKFPTQAQFSYSSFFEHSLLFWSLPLPTPNQPKVTSMPLVYWFNDGFSVSCPLDQKCESSFVSAINPIKVFTSSPESLLNANKQVQQRHKHGVDC